MKHDESQDLPEHTAEALIEFMNAFHKLWATYEMARPEKPPRKETGTPCDPYVPIPCPGSGGGGGLPAMCKAINEWAQCWKTWGDAVHKKLWGGPGPTPPPPPPPFE